MLNIYVPCMRTVGKLVVWQTWEADGVSTNLTGRMATECAGWQHMAKM